MKQSRVKLFEDILWFFASVYGETDKAAILARYANTIENLGFPWCHRPLEISTPWGEIRIPAVNARTQPSEIFAENASRIIRVGYSSRWRHVFLSKTT